MKQAYFVFQSSLVLEWDLTGLQSSGWPAILRNVDKNPKIPQFSICNSLTMSFSCGSFPRCSAAQTPVFSTHQAGSQHTEEATVAS